MSRHLILGTAGHADRAALIQIHLDRPAILMNQDHYIIRNSSIDTTIGGRYRVEYKLFAS
ncbi:MAG TPA: hypothetical protein PKH94_05020 [Bacteroidales bacterium]|nr:hypothetical protein [Bacteroidales bacterium]HNS46579.1 hypothetical protein [Bacteroidales bacterium]